MQCQDQYYFSKLGNIFIFFFSVLTVTGTLLCWLQFCHHYSKLCECDAWAQTSALIRVSNWFLILCRAVKSDKIANTIHGFAESNRTANDVMITEEITELLIRSLCFITIIAYFALIVTFWWLLRHFFININYHHHCH